MRVAILGAGPSGFYAAEHLFKQKDLVIEVDMYDRLPTPFGLVRGGVAPDHPKIKSVTKVYDRIASNPRVRFFGNIEMGADITVESLRDYYHQILYATGTQTGRTMNIPGEELEGSHSATDFVAWYNGHPDYRDLEFDLSVECAAVVGMGNVALDVARILSRTPEELGTTDIADHALEVLAESKIKEVYILGRRGPVQAKYTPKEVKELGELADAEIVVRPEEVFELDPISQEELETAPDRATQRNVEIVQEFARREPSGKSRKLHLRFLVSPVELIGDDDGKVAAIRVVKNKLRKTDSGGSRPQATDEYEELPVGLVFSAVGYQGVPLLGVPYREDWGIIPNVKGRVVTDPESERRVVGEYVTGWIKRGPSGVIGTNKADSVETVECMLEDLAMGLYLGPSKPEADAVEEMFVNCKPTRFSWEDWQRVDEVETTKGERQGRPRVKFTSVDDMLDAREDS